MKDPVQLEQTKGLNTEQSAVVLHDKGPALVIAGAGTGKTTVITRRIAWLIATGKAHPNEILALTFTDKAAREMEERLDVLLPYGFVNTNILTFHALGDQILRDNALEIGISTDFQVMSSFQQIIFMQQILPELGLDYYSPLGNPYQFLESLLAHFSRLKDECITPELYRNFASTKITSSKTEEERVEASRLVELAGAYSVYQDQTRAQAKLDFGDQISLTIELFKTRPNVLKRYQEHYKYILVDEYQDTNFAQNEFVKMLSEKHHNIMVVGDDDQSIYRFRGAAITNILGFSKQYPKAKQLVLNKNYRSSQEILDVSYELIQHNNPDRLEIQNKINKRLKGNKGGGKPELIQATTLSEEMKLVGSRVSELIQSGLEPKNIAILLRKNKQAGPMLLALEAEGILGESSQRDSLFARTEIKALINFIAVVNDPSDSAAMYGLLVGDMYNLHVDSLVSMSSKAHREHVSLQAYLMEQGDNEPRIAQALDDISAFRGYAAELSAGQLLYKYINEQGYLGRLLKQAEESNEGAAKVQNIAQFFNLIREFEAMSFDPTVYHFWSYISQLKASEADILAMESPLDQNAVQIMTVHRAKGLEFEAVFMIDLVNEVFPSRRMAEKIQIPDGLIQIENTGDLRDIHIAEERRLFYVGLTRAKNYLTLSCSFDHGGARMRKISQFVKEALGEGNIPSFDAQAKAGALQLIADFAETPSLAHDLTAHLYSDGWLHLTPHQIDDYLRDPEKFWLFHVLKLPQGPFHALVYGSAVHHAIEFYYRAKLNQQKVSLMQMQQAFDDAWSSEGFVSKRHEQQRLERGHEVIKRFYAKHEAGGELPSAVEQSFSFVLPELKVRISGRYDAIYQRIHGDKGEQELEIRDFKTSAATNQAAADRKLKDNIQMAIYALAWERTTKTPVHSLTLDFVEAGYLATTRKIDHAKTIQQIKKVAEGIANREFKSGGNAMFKVTQPW